MNELIISTLILSITGWTAMFMKSLRRSRCSNVKCLCVECKREVLDTIDESAELEDINIIDV